MQSYNEDKDSRELPLDKGSKFNIWTTLPRSPLSMPSLVNRYVGVVARPTKGSLDSIEHDTSANYLSELSESTMTKIRLTPDIQNVPSPTVYHDGNNQVDLISFEDPSVVNMPKIDKAVGSRREHTLRSALSVFSEQLPSPPPSPSEFHGIRDRDTALLELSNRTGYNIVQRNGQRIYGGPPPGWEGPPPGRGCEIFVGKVPRDCYEDELVPIFEKVGRIYELRLMMDFSGSNKGFMFVRYSKPEEAKRAIRELDKIKLHGKVLGVLKSVDNRKLWISGIPQNCTADEIQREMEILTEGVLRVQLYPAKTDRSWNTGYFYVEYTTHGAAAVARRKLVPDQVFVCGMLLNKVDWAEPEPEVDEEELARVCVLFVRNLASQTSEEDLWNLFSNLSNGNVERVRKFDINESRSYAFVHFVTREAAEKALALSGNLMLDGAQLDVSWKKPVDKVAYNQRKQNCQAIFAPKQTNIQPKMTSAGFTTRLDNRGLRRQPVPFRFGPPSCKEQFPHVFGFDREPNLDCSKALMPYSNPQRGPVFRQDFTGFAKNNFHRAFNAGNPYPPGVFLNPFAQLLAMSQASISAYPVGLPFRNISARYSTPGPSFVTTYQNHLY